MAGPHPSVAATRLAVRRCLADLEPGATVVVADEDAVPSAPAAQPVRTVVSRRAHTAARAAGRGERMGTVSRSGRGLATRS